MVIDASGKPSAHDGEERRCSHCGRLVHETHHTRADFLVDFYELHTGQVEAAVLRRSEDGPGQPYWRLLVPELVVTCRDCYRDPQIQDERERRFRPERSEQLEADATA